MKTFKFLLVASTALLTANFVSAQTWTQTSAPNNRYWQAIASSANGSKLIAIAIPWGSIPSSIYTSTNSGASWASNGLPWLSISGGGSIASSADGTKLVAKFDNGIYISTNSGTSWTQTSASNYFNWPAAIASSADGTRLVATTLGGTVYTSTNSGTTWNTTSAPSNFWAGVAFSADGVKLVAAVGNGGIYTSTNSGAAWTQTSAPTNRWGEVASSADGSKLAAQAWDGYPNHTGSIYLSTDSGNTWTMANTPSESWASVACSADGSKLVGTVYGGGIYTSTNSGATWTRASAPINYWGLAASSADGDKLVAVVGGAAGGIYISQSMRVPSINITPINSNLTLSWIIPSTNFVMQQSADLTSWTDATNPPILNLTNLQNEVTLPMPAGSGFYRLKTP